MITVIIPNWNGKQFLKTCLHSLRRQTLKDYQVIVVDNGSTDGSVSFLIRNYPEVKLIKFSKNKGFAAAVNQGIKESQGEFVALLNNDVEADPSWLEELSRGLKENPEVGFCASKMLDFTNRRIIMEAGDGYTRSGYAFQIGNDRPDIGQYDSPKKVFGACAGAAIYRRSMFDKIGFFDEDFFAYLEDIDLSFRAQLMGYECLYIPSAVVYHVGSASTGSRYNDITVYFSAQNTINTLIKNMPASILCRNIFRILKLLILLQGHYIIRSKYGRAYFKGLLSAFRQLKPMLRKRKQIQDNKKISHKKIEQFLIASEQELLQQRDKLWRMVSPH
ncbi:hypothetical protein ES703_49191 [subsurface metagenome]